jgi:niacin transporter
MEPLKPEQPHDEMPVRTEPDLDEAAQNTDRAKEDNTAPADSAAAPQKRPFHKTKIITYSAALSALGMIIVMFMPTVDIGITSITPASHVPLMLSMMIHPIVAAFTGIVTAVSFLPKHANPMVLFRATSHLFFAIPGAFLAQKLLRPEQSTQNLKRLTVNALALNGITAALHAAFEVVASTVGYYALTSLGIGLPPGFTFTAYGMLVTLGLITVAHSVVDFFIAYAVYIPLRRAKLIGIRQ